MHIYIYIYTYLSDVVWIDIHEWGNILTYVGRSESNASWLFQSGTSTDTENTITTLDRESFLLRNSLFPPQSYNHWRGMFVTEEQKTCQSHNQKSVPTTKFFPVGIFEKIVHLLSAQFGRKSWSKRSLFCGWQLYRTCLVTHNAVPAAEMHHCSVSVNVHHHHHVVPQARISLTLSRHSSLSFIASGRSSGLHPVSSHSSCM